MVGKEIKKEGGRRKWKKIYACISTKSSGLGSGKYAESRKCVEKCSGVLGIEKSEYGDYFYA